MSANAPKQLEPDLQSHIGDVLRGHLRRLGSTANPSDLAAIQKRVGSRLAESITSSIPDELQKESTLDSFGVPKADTKDRTPITQPMGKQIPEEEDVVPKKNVRVPAKEEATKTLEDTPSEENKPEEEVNDEREEPIESSVEDTLETDQKKDKQIAQIEQTQQETESSIRADADEATKEPRKNISYLNREIRPRQIRASLLQGPLRMAQATYASAVALSIAVMVIGGVLTILIITSEIGIPCFGWGLRLYRGAKKTYKATTEPIKQEIAELNKEIVAKKEEIKKVQTVIKGIQKETQQKIAEERRKYSELIAAADHSR